MISELEDELRTTHRRGRASGLPPGTPVFVGEQKQDTVTIHVIAYSGDQLEEIQHATLADCHRLAAGNGISWINVSGMHDVTVLKELANCFGLHPLTTEDISNTTERPKVEEFEDYIFFALKMLTYNTQANDIDHENVSVILGHNFVISFQERSSAILDPVCQRLRSGKGKIRSEGADYLAYTIMDLVVDEYFVSLEKLDDHIEDVDDQILATPNAALMKELHRLKREIVLLRKSVWPLREEIASIEKSRSPLISDAIRPFLRDLHDHTIQVMDMVEMHRDLIASMHDTYLSSISNRMNEVMKVLTIIGTIFIPLTFVAGIYGMNFDYMPELRWRWGYFALLGAMTALALAMLALFRKRNWL